MPAVRRDGTQRHPEELRATAVVATTVDRQHRSEAGGEQPRGRRPRARRAARAATSSAARDDQRRRGGRPRHRVTRRWCTALLTGPSTTTRPASSTTPRRQRRSISVEVVADDDEGSPLGATAARSGAGTCLGRPRHRRRGSRRRGRRRGRCARRPRTRGAGTCPRSRTAPGCRGTARCRRTSTISSKRASIWAGRMPRIDALRCTFSRPVRSGWKPAPTSSSPASRPRTRTRPVSGAITPATSLRSVDFPEPLRPSRATDSPWAISRSSGARATKSSWPGAPLRPPTRRDSLSEWVCRSRKCLEAFSTETAVRVGCRPGSELLREATRTAAGTPAGRRRRGRAGRRRNAMTRVGGEVRGHLREVLGRCRRPRAPVHELDGHGHAGSAGRARTATSPAPSRSATSCHG